MAGRWFVLLLGLSLCHAFFAPGHGTGLLSRERSSFAPSRERVGSRRRQVGACMSLLGLKLDVPVEPPCKVGDHVRVKAGLAPLRHVPGHKDGFDASGSEGEVLRVYAEPNLSCTLPIKVQFQEPKPWIGHFTFNEVEPVHQ